MQGDDIKSFEDLACYFNETVDNLKKMVQLKHAVDDTEYEEHLEDLHSEVDSLDIVVSCMRTEIKKQKEKLQAIEGMKNNIKQLTDHLQYTLANIPARLPQMVQPQNANNSSEKKVNGTAHPNKTPTENSSVSTSVSSGENNKRQTKHKTKYIPTVSYLMMDEFDSIPKYMKGRLTYDQLNTVIDQFNQAFQGKYKILHMKKTAMSDYNRKQFDKYKSQENKESAGLYFVVDDDIKEFSSAKMDSVMRSKITILRHCNRIREVRGGGCTRFVYIES